MSIFAYGNKAKCEPKYNEDNFLVRKVGKYVVLMIADGNGSEPGNVDAGSLCTSLAVDWVAHGLMKANGEEKDLTPEQVGDVLNSALFGLSRVFISINALDDKYSSIYTSLSVAVIEELTLDMICASIGNCEIHRVRDGKDEILNTIHSEAYKDFQNGNLTEDGWRESPKRGILYSALGGFDEPSIDVFETTLQPDDIVYISSDGLFHVTNPQGILEELFDHADDIPTAVDSVLEKAVDYKCPDNCSLIVGYVQNDVRGRETVSNTPVQRRSSNRSTGLSEARNASEHVGAASADNRRQTIESNRRESYQRQSSRPTRPSGNRRY